MKFNIPQNEAGDDSGGGGGAAVADTAAASQPASLLGSSTPATPAPSNPQPPAGQAGAFDFRQLVGDDGNFAPDFHSKLPEDLKGLEKFRSPKQLLEGYRNLETLMGKKADAVVIPRADAPKEDWAPVLKRLGVPDSPDGYGLKVPENLPEGVSVNPAELKEFATFAHGLGLTPQQVSKLQEFDIGRAGKQVAGGAAQAQALAQQEFASQQDVLNKAWGNGNERTQKAALAERAALTFGFTQDEVKSDPLFRNAKFVMALARAGAAMSEDTLVKGSEVNSAGGMKAKGLDIINNPQNPLYKAYHDGSEDVRLQVQSYLRAG